MIMEAAGFMLYFADLCRVCEGEEMLWFLQQVEWSGTAVFKLLLFSAALMAVDHWIVSLRRQEEELLLLIHTILCDRLARRKKDCES